MSCTNRRQGKRKPAGLTGGSLVSPWDQPGAATRAASSRRMAAMMPLPSATSARLMISRLQVRLRDKAGRADFLRSSVIGAKRAN